ncbi:MAG: HAMP domain-containing histidine kinase [Planctomycetes bacterium]|nr:HAMP domain-containing histidine kinase [Planctomycetota bacterium]
MRRPLQLEVGSRRWLFPTADASLAAIARSLLAAGSDDSEAASAALAGQLAGDPPLLLWAVCKTAVEGQPAPRSVSDVAHALAAGALDWMSCPGQTDLAEEPSSDQAREYADRVAGDLATAQLAGAMAQTDGAECAQAAILFGLLAAATDWLALCAGSPISPDTDSTEGASPLPEDVSQWLAGHLPAEAVRCVEQAVEMLRGSEPSAESHAAEVEAAGRVAAEGRWHWLAQVPHAGAMFPRLADRLVRLRQLEEDFQVTLESEKLESLAEFAAGAGHEINNPLTVIAGRAQMLLHSETDRERCRGLALMKVQAMRVHEMIADLRLFSRPPELDLQQTDLVEPIDSLLAKLAPRAAAHAIVLQRTGDPGPLEARVDEVQLTVALKAICENAIESIGHTGKIDVSLDGDDREIRIAVTDDGKGIPDDEVRRHLFDPYYSGRQAGRGLGFGLSKAWRIVTNHGGRIDVESEPKKGATFTIVLPRGG